MKTMQPNMIYGERPFGASRLPGALGMPSQTLRGFGLSGVPSRTHQPCDPSTGLVTGSAEPGLSVFGMAGSRSGLSQAA